MKPLFDSLSPSSTEFPDCISQGEALGLCALPRGIKGGEVSISLLFSILDASGFWEW